MAPRRRRVMLAQIFRVPMKREGFQVLSLDQAEMGHTSLLSALKFNFHSWLQINTELPSDCTAASASSFLCAIQ